MGALDRSGFFVCGNVGLRTTERSMAGSLAGDALRRSGLLPAGEEVWFIELWRRSLGVDRRAVDSTLLAQHLNEGRAATYLVHPRSGFELWRRSSSYSWLDKPVSVSVVVM